MTEPLIINLKHSMFKNNISKHEEKVPNVSQKLRITTLKGNSLKPSKSIQGNRVPINNEIIDLTGNLEKPLQELEISTNDLTISDVELRMQFRNFRLPDLLDDDEVTKIKQLIKDYEVRKIDEIVVSAFGLHLRVSDMNTLKEGIWIDDEVINMYMNLLIDRGTQPGYPEVYAYNTFFYSEKLIIGGHFSVRRWTRHVDIFAKEFLVIPIMLDRNHWALVIININKKEIIFYDSLYKCKETCINTINNLKDYLKKEYLYKKQKHLNFDDWICGAADNIPLQKNGIDCGVFLCVYAEYVTANKTFNFSQNDMTYFRKKIFKDIIKKRIL